MKKFIGLTIICLIICQSTFGVDFYKEYSRLNSENIAIDRFSEINSIDEDEPNNNMRNATRIKATDEIEGKISYDYYDIDWYEFDFLGEGSIEIIGEMGSYTEYLNIGIYDEDEQEIKTSKFTLKDGKMVQKIEIDLDKDTYYLCIYQKMGSSFPVGERYSINLISDYEIINEIDYIYFEKSSVNLNVGDKELLKVKIKPSDLDLPEIEYRSDDKEVATVDSNGLVEAVGKGNCNIYAENLTLGLEDICKIEVGDVLVEDIELSSYKVTLQEGEAFNVEAKVLPGNATHKEIYWETSNDDIADVYSNGRIYARGEGQCVIYCKSWNHKIIKEIQVIVLPENMNLNEVEGNNSYADSDDYFLNATMAGDFISSLDVDYYKFNNKKSGKFKLSARFGTYDPYLAIILYDSKYQKIGQSSLVNSEAGNYQVIEMPIDQGEYYLKVELIESKYAGIIVTEKIGYNFSTKIDRDGEKPYEIELENEQLTLDIGGNYLLNIKSSIGEMGELVWESSNEKVANVNNGVVNGNIPGTAIISVYDENRKVIDSCLVRVNIPNYEFVSFPNKSDIATQHQFEIKFSEAVDLDNINNKIFIVNEDKESLDLEYEYKDESKKIIVVKSKLGYLNDKNYTMYIVNVEGISGKQLTKNYRMYFNIIN